MSENEELLKNLHKMEIIKKKIDKYDYVIIKNFSLKDIIKRRKRKDMK